MVKKSLTLCLAFLGMISLPPAFDAIADDRPSSTKDEALDDLLKKLDDGDKPGDSLPGAAGEKGSKAAPRPKDETKPSGSVSSKDKDIDSLLEKLGSSDDKPATEEERRPGGADAGDPRDRQPGGPSPDPKKADPTSPQGKDKALDEHLEEAAGKRRKKAKEGSEDGPLSKVVKEMREVEERLGKPDTGEETREKQAEIVKKISTLIEQAGKSQSQSKSKKKSRSIVKGKPRPGQPGEGDEPGTTGGNAPFTKPARPNDRRSLAGGKEIWGDLPPEVRQDLDNVMKEGFLPSREELIKRYYLSLSKKKAIRGE